MEPLLIRIGDIRASGHCVKGAKAWMERHGFDFKNFLRNGAKASELLETKDALAQRVVRETAKRRARGG
jgi:hypothetical protein